jgi:hypothetical protein
MKLPANWKTSLMGLISAAAAFVLYAQSSHMVNFPTWATALAGFVQIGGLAGLGLTAKDFNTTGGTVGQPSTLEALTAANQQPHSTNPPKQ